MATMNREISGPLAGHIADGRGHSTTFSCCRYRRGSTVVVVGGPKVGTIGTATGGDRGTVYIEEAFGTDRRLVVAPGADVLAAPHPLSWYDRPQTRHGYCEGCDTVQAAMTARREVAR